MADNIISTRNQRPKLAQFACGNCERYFNNPQGYVLGRWLGYISGSAVVLVSNNNMYIDIKPYFCLSY